MTAILQAHALGKRYGQRQALTDCTLEIPPGHVVGLVGPNGAGKTTLLKIACGMLAPTTGSIEVLGEQPAAGPAQLARVGYVAQDTPIYASLSVADHLTLGAKLNPGWDATLAQARIDALGLDRKQKAGKLSGGQRAQLALTVAVAKRPELLILDEPVASLDPLARRDFLRHLMESVADNDTSVILSSHLVSDLERVCDYLIVLVASRVQLAGETEDLLAQHHRLVCTRRQDTDLPAGLEVIWAEHTERQSTFIVRSQADLPAGDWSAEHLDLEDLVLTYMERAAATGSAIDRREARDDLAHLAPIPRPSPHRPGPARRRRDLLPGHRAGDAPHLHRRPGLLHAAEQLRRRAQPVPAQLRRHVPPHRTPRARRPGADRHVLGRAADRPGTGDRHPPIRVEPDRHPHPVARGQTHRRRPRLDRHRRGPQLPDDLVGRTARPHRRQPVRGHDLRHPRHRPARLRRLRLRPRRHRRTAAAPHRPGHGRHARRVHRHPDPRAHPRPPATCCPRPRSRFPSTRPPHSRPAASTPATAVPRCTSTACPYRRARG